MASPVFWGLLVILIGLSIVLNATLGIKIPVVRIVFGLIVIYIGLTLIFGHSLIPSKSGPYVVFGESKQDVTAETLSKEYNVIFGKGEFDLRGLPPPAGVQKLEFNVIFGHGILIVDPEMPLQVKASAAFGTSVLPDGGQVSFGDRKYKTDDSADRYLKVKLNAVFGQAEIVRRPR